MATKKRRAANGEGTTPVLRADGRWHSRVTYTDEQGVRRRKDIYGKTSTECVKNKRTFQAKVDAGKLPSSDRQTVEQYLASWLENTIRGNVRLISYLGYERNCRKHIIPVVGHHRLVDLRPAHVQQLVRDLKAKGLSNVSIGKIMIIFRSALRHAVSTRLLPENPATYVKLPRKDPPPTRYLTPDQARALLEACKGHRQETLFVVALSLGLRRGEVMALTWQDVDLDAGVLHVRHTRYWTEAGYVTETPKTRSGKRQLFLPAVTRNALCAHRERQQLDRQRVGPKWQNTDYVFTNRVGGPLSPEGYRGLLNRMATKAGIVDINVHGLRHSAVSLLIAQKVDIKLIAEIMGHSSINITLNTYAHLFDAQRREAADAMNDILTGDR